MHWSPEPYLRIRSHARALRLNAKEASAGVEHSLFFTDGTLLAWAKKHGGSAGRGTVAAAGYASRHRYGSSLC